LHNLEYIQDQDLEYFMYVSEDEDYLLDMYQDYLAYLQD